jgi:hypothetical protein
MDEIMAVVALDDFSIDGYYFTKGLWCLAVANATTPEETITWKFEYNCKLETVNKIDGKFLYQANWNQNDKNSPDYITDRPFYDYTNTKTIMSERTFQSNYVIGHTAFELEPEHLYQVCFDDINYEFIANVFDGNVCIGNASIVYPSAPDTGESFLLNDNNGTNCLYTLDKNDTSYHTVSINEIVRNLKQIEDKFIPDTIARVSDVNYAIGQLSEEIGDIDAALDAIIAMQESYIGGEGA